MKEENQPNYYFTLANFNKCPQKNISLQLITPIISFKLLMKFVVAFIFFFSITFEIRADRIYILPGIGYNQAGPDIISAITSLGHTVVAGVAGSTTLPAGFTTACVDPVNGYHWLCLFGVIDYIPLQPQIKAFIDAGGKVYHQHEVTCCTVSTTSVASLASAFTGLTITPNAASFIANGGMPAWEAVNAGNCVYMSGAAYKCLDGIPSGHTLNATANLNGSSPPYTDCENFGVYFETTDFIGAAHNGAYVAIGDINLFYNGFEPPNNGGTTPVDMNVINFFFPNELTSCFLFHPGCIITTAINSIQNDFNIQLYTDNTHHQLIVAMKQNNKTSIALLNSLGQQVMFFDGIQSDQFTISTAGLNNGIYFVIIGSGEQSFVRKILIE